jgi:hypothetical protein
MSGRTTAEDSALLDDKPSGKARRGWGQRLWVYVVMLVAALVGMSYTNTGGPDASGFGPSIARVWLFVVPIYFLSCVWHGWAAATARGARLRLVATQALHWLAFLGAMYLTLMPDVRGIVNDDSVGILMLLLLAMGTFLAGVHAWSWPICLVGILLALAVPALAWLEATTMLLVIVLVGVVLAAVVALALWRRFTGDRSAPGPA